MYFSEYRSQSLLSVGVNTSNPCENAFLCTRLCMQIISNAKKGVVDLIVFHRKKITHSWRKSSGFLILRYVDQCIISVFLQLRSVTL